MLPRYAILPELSGEEAVQPNRKGRKHKLRRAWLSCWLILFVIAGAGAIEKWEMNAHSTKAQGTFSPSILAMWHISLPSLKTMGNRSISVTQQRPVSNLPLKPTSPARTSSVQPAKVLLRVPAMSQNPEFRNGCEVTSLAMLLNYTGHNVSKGTLADTIEKDPTPEQVNADGAIVSWGNPNRGFVGNIQALGAGYGVYHGPIVTLLNRYWPRHGLDLTGQSFDAVLASLQKGHPVIAWTTIQFAPTKNWVTWQSTGGVVKATWDEHTVVIVGYDADNIYVNDPADGATDKKVSRDEFTASWVQLGSQAVTYS